MKKFLILTGIAVLAFMSCAKDEIKQVNKGHAIDFKVVETKGDVVEWASDVDHFYVTAFAVEEDGSGSIYFENVGFARTGNYFGSNPEYYWPTDGNGLLFLAYTPGADKTGATVNMSLDTKTYEIADFSPAADINDHVDLMTCLAGGTKEDCEESGVSLTFNHKLARIKVRTYESNTEYDYSVAGVRIVNLSGKGTLNIVDQTNNCWTLEEEKATYTLEYDNNPIEVRSYKETMMYNSHDDRNYNDAMVLPQTLTAWDPVNDPSNTRGGAYIGLKLQITSVESGDQIYPATAGEYGWVAIPVPDGLTLKEGLTYNFDLNLTTGAGYTDPSDGPAEDILGQDIMFTVQVNASETPSTEATLRKELEGNWRAKKVVVTWRYHEGYDGVTYNEYTRETEDEVKKWFGNNGFYQFSVDNNYNITTTTASGVSSTCSFTVDEENYIYIENYFINGEYQIIPRVHSIDEENNICIIETISENYYTDVDRIEHLYYDRK